MKIIVITDFSSTKIHFVTFKPFFIFVGSRQYAGTYTAYFFHTQGDYRIFKLDLTLTS